MRFLFYLLNVWSLVGAIVMVLNRHDIMNAACLASGSEYLWEDTDCLPQQIPDRIECLAKNTFYIQSVVKCMQQLQQAHNVSDVELQKGLKSMVKGAIRKVKISPREIYQINSNIADETFATHTDKSTPVSGATSFDPTLVSNYYARYEMTWWNKQRSQTFGVATLAYWGGICFLKHLTMMAQQYAPFLMSVYYFPLSKFIRRYFILPPLFGFHHATPVRVGPYLTFQLPTRYISTVVVLFVVLNYALMFSDIPEIANALYMGSKGQQFNQYLADRSARLVLFKLPLVFLFCGRNNFMIIFTGWGMNEFNIFHKWLGRITFVDIVIHAIAASIFLRSDGMYSSMFTHTAWLKWGISAISVFGVLFIQSIHWIRRLNYEVFKYLHIGLTMLLLALVYQHIRGPYMGFEFMYACWAVWVFDHFARWTRILVSGITTKGTFMYHGGALEITLDYNRVWKPYGGRYVFLHVLNWDSFWQSHPFSIMRAVRPGEEGKLKIMARAKDGITKKWVERCIREGGMFKAHVFVDGPYGLRKNFKSFNELVFIAGGIGISAPYAYLQNKIRRDTSQTISLYWGIPNEEPLTWFSTELAYLAQSGKIDIHIFIGLDPGDDGSESVRSLESGTRANEEPPSPDRNFGKLYDPRKFAPQSIRFDDDSDHIIQASDTTPESVPEYGPHTITASDAFDLEKLINLNAGTRSELSLPVGREPFSIQNTGKLHFYNRQMDLRYIVESHIMNTKKNLALFSCGPAHMNDTTRSAFTESFIKSDKPTQYFEEHFSW